MPDSKRKPAKAAQRTTTKAPAKKSKAAASGFTPEERAAMRERARELKAEARAGSKKADGDAEVRAKLASMPEADRAIGERIHEIVTTSAPDLVPRLWYGMPAFAKDGKVLCFFQDAGKFGSRYATLGFSDVANLDEGTMWSTGFAVTKLTPADEKRIAQLVRRAVRTR